MNLIHLWEVFVTQGRVPEEFFATSERTISESRTPSEEGKTYSIPLAHRVSFRWLDQQTGNGNKEILSSFPDSHTAKQVSRRALNLATFPAICLVFDDHTRLTGDFHWLVSQTVTS